MSRAASPLNFGGKYVETYAWADGRFEVHHKGFSLPYRFFEPDKRSMTHAAIIENKRLSAALAYARSCRMRGQRTKP